MRNLYSPTYVNAGTLVLLINKNECFENYSVFPSGTSVTLHVDDCNLRLIGEEVTAKETGKEEMGGVSGYTWDNGILCIYHDMLAGDHRITSLVRFDDSSSFTLFYGYKTILIGMVFCLIPLLSILLWVFYRHVTKPVEKMMDGRQLLLTQQN